MRRACFFYDLGSPYAYLAATRIDEVFDADAAVEWVPVLLGGIFKATGRSSWSETSRRSEGIREVETRAAAYGLPALRWPNQWPNDGLTAMRIACWAHARDAGRRFAAAAFAEQFANGNALSEVAAIENAARDAGLDPAAALAAAADPTVKATLRANTERALALGVIGVPTVEVDGELFWGDDRLHEAAAASRV